MIKRGEQHTITLNSHQVVLVNYLAGLLHGSTGFGIFTVVDKKLSDDQHDLVLSRSRGKDPFEFSKNGGLKQLVKDVLDLAEPKPDQPDPQQGLIDQIAALQRKVDKLEREVKAGIHRNY
jgi:hypothetical protein